MEAFGVQNPVNKHVMFSIRVLNTFWKVFSGFRTPFLSGRTPLCDFGSLGGDWELVGSQAELLGAEGAGNGRLEGGDQALGTPEPGAPGAGLGDRFPSRARPETDNIFRIFRSGGVYVFASVFRIHQGSSWCIVGFPSGFCIHHLFRISEN